MPVDCDVLCEYLRNGSLIAFVGAGVSRTYQDATTGTKWIGVPSGMDIVGILSSRRSYIKSNMSFPEACFLVRQREGRAQLESLLLEFIDRPAINPLPAHVILANLGFPAYITTNYDSILERALANAKRQYHPIITQEDVSRLRSIHIPVLKLHGCVTRPTTMIACEDEYVSLTRNRPIIDSLLRALLSYKNMIFLGFSLDDEDFKNTFEQVKFALGDYMPRSFAVVNSITDYRREYWLKNGIDIIKDDLTSFLRRLLRESVHETAPVVYDPREDWINNAFFESLLRIRTLPSETQVIDAFFSHFLHEIESPGLTLEDVTDLAMKATKLVLTRRPNFEGFRKTCVTVVEKITKSCGSKEEAELHIKSVIASRINIGQRIAEKARKCIARGDNLLIYSQSVRVLELLKGAPRGVQDTCHLFIAECRPKSPDAFQDSLTIAESLLGTGYEITIIPDAAIGGLITRRQVNKVLMGAHSILTLNDVPRWFINTSGSRLIVSAARESNVPLYIVAENAKISPILSDDVEPEISLEEEEDIFATISANISDLKAKGQKLGHLNIGYDLCPFLSPSFLVTEDRP